jgi:hypothetical protein
MKPNLFKNRLEKQSLQAPQGTPTNNNKLLNNS